MYKQIYCQEKHTVHKFNGINYTWVSIVTFLNIYLPNKLFTIQLSIKIVTYRLHGIGGTVGPNRSELEIREKIKISQMFLNLFKINYQIALEFIKRML